MTPQYAGLRTLHDDNDGFAVLAFPCNQFAGQEPGTNEEIRRFATDEYGATFPMFAKIDVNGEHEEPLYTWLKQQQPGDGEHGDITWNFEKFLIDRDGNVVKRYGPMVEPAEIEPDVKELL